MTDPLSSSGRRWSCRDALFLCEILDAYRDEETRELVLMVAAQSAKTSTMYPALAWQMAEDPCSILWLCKNLSEAKKTANTRLGVMLERCKALHGKLAKTRSRRKMLERGFDGGVLVIASSEDSAALQSTPYRVLFLDEARSYPRHALSMVSKRTRSFPHTYKKVTFSTPDREGDQLHREYQFGNQCEWHVRCPCCGLYQPMLWGEKGKPGGMKWDTNEKTQPGGVWNFDAVVASLRWECRECDFQCRDTARERKALSNSGKWVANNPNAPKSHRSFTWNALLPYWTSWRDQLIERLKAYEALKGGDYEPMKSFVTETEGRPWAEEMQYPKGDIESLAGRLGSYSPDDHFEWEVRRLATVDVQAKGGRHFWMVIRAWGRGGISRLIWAGRCWTQQEWERICTENRVTPDNVVIDSGYEPGEVYQMVEGSGRRYKAWKGEGADYFTRTGGDGKPRRSMWHITKVDPAMGTARQGKATPIPLYLYSKPKAFEVLRMLQEGSIGDWQYHADVPADYLPQVTAYAWRERTNRLGHTSREMHQRRKDDHMASCEMMQVAAASLNGLMFEQG